MNRKENQSYSFEYLETFTEAFIRFFLKVQIQDKMHIAHF